MTSSVPNQQQTQDFQQALGRRMVDNPAKGKDLPQFWRPPLVALLGKLSGRIRADVAIGISGLVVQRA